MFCDTTREPDMAKLGFLRWLAEQGKLEHEVFGQSWGDFVLEPNVEVGVGDNLTLVAVNFEFIYPFASRQPWHVYAGGGPALNWFRSNGVSDSGAGLNLLLRLEHRNGVFFEAKIGTFDSPDLKFGVGYTFR